MARSATQPLLLNCLQTPSVQCIQTPSNYRQECFKLVFAPFCPEERSAKMTSEQQHFSQLLQGNCNFTEQLSV